MNSVPLEVIDAQEALQPNLGGDVNARYVAVPSRRATTAKPMPCSQEAEEHVLACCLLDEGVTLDKAIAIGLKPPSFFWPANEVLFGVLCDMRAAKQNISLEVLAEELRTRRLLDQIGGFAYLMQVTGKIPTTAHAGYFIKKVRELSQRRQLIRDAQGVLEQAYAGADLEELTAKAKLTLGEIEPPQAQVPSKSLFDFPLVLDGDQSILLGNRYLNRGDGAVIVSTSGMGKSTIAVQGAAELALQLGPFGITGNGPLTSLIVQSEDSEGDIAEVAHSLKHVLKLTPEQIAIVNQRVHIVTDRVNRGVRFIAVLKKLIEKHKPDLVWINPLHAFMDGDVTDAKDLGAFLREGLNSLNQPATFGYIIIHHTTKPATGKERTERLWHEVMYDMAGGAEIINWARAIISLRATPTEGEFNLVLAKRGRRAGVTKKVPNGIGFVLEPVTAIPLKHSTGRLEIPGISKGLPLVYWLPRETPDVPTGKSKSDGRPAKYLFNDYRTLFPTKSSSGMTINELHRALLANGEIQKKNLHSVCKRWAEDGDIEIIDIHGQPRRYRAAF